MIQIAIVGGGASGILSVLALLRTLDQAANITLFEPHSEIGRGVAYSTPHQFHLLNVPAAKMGAFADHQRDFYEWCRRSGLEVGEGDFLSRHLYGDYLVTTFQTELARRRTEITFSHRSAIVTRIERADGGFFVASQSGGLQVDVVILAPGIPATSVPGVVGRYYRGTAPRADIVVDPWNGDLRLPEGVDSNILILGTGLTAVDTALSCFELGFEGGITLLSRHGLKPNAHAPVDGLPLNLRHLVGQSPLRILHELRALQREIPWRLVIDSLRPVTVEIWRAWNVHQQRAFLRHLKSYWEVHRHRMAPVISDQIDAFTKKGRLTIRSGRIDNVENTSGGIKVSIRDNRHHGSRDQVFNQIINCTGFGPLNSSSFHGLLGQLTEHGLVTMRSDGLGVSTPEGTTITADRGFFIMGALLRGERWESTAIPELRQQAAEIATEVRCLF